MPTNFLNNLKLDRWWKGFLWIGILFIISQSFMKFDFLDGRHIFGFGFGMMFIGLSFWMAEKKDSWIKPPNAYTGGAALITQYEIQHNVITILLLAVGIILFLLFGFLIFRSLI